MEGLDEEVEEVVCPRKKCPLWRATEYSKDWTPGNQESEYNDPSFIHPSTQSVIQSIQWESVSHSPRAMSFFFRFRGGIRFLTSSEEGGHRSSILIGRITSNPCPVVLTRTVCGYCIIFPRVTNSIPAFDWLTDVTGQPIISHLRTLLTKPFIGTPRAIHPQFEQKQLMN